jgi:signal peptidase I
VFRLVRLLALACLGGTAVASGLLAVLARRSPSGHARAWGRELFIVESNAMAPGIHAGDLVVLRLTVHAGMEYDVGDVVAFRPDDRRSFYVAHRIVGVRRDRLGVPVYLTRGDSHDGDHRREFGADAVIGDVEARLPYVGRALAAVRDRTTAAVLALSTLLAVLAPPATHVGPAPLAPTVRRRSWEASA